MEVPYSLIACIYLHSQLSSLESICVCAEGLGMTLTSIHIYSPQLCYVLPVALGMLDWMNSV